MKSKQTKSRGSTHRPNLCTSTFIMDLDPGLRFSGGRSSSYSALPYSYTTPSDGFNSANRFSIVHTFPKKPDNTRRALKCVKEDCNPPISRFSQTRDSFVPWHHASARTHHSPSNPHTRPSGHPPLERSFKSFATHINMSFHAQRRRGDPEHVLVLDLAHNNVGDCVEEFAHRGC